MKQLKNKKMNTKAATEALKKMDEAAKQKTDNAIQVLVTPPHEPFNKLPFVEVDPGFTPSIKPAHNPPIMIAEHKSQMKDNERKELIQRIKAMSQEELELVAELIPVDLCLRRIDGELQKAKRFEESIKSTMNILEE